MSFFKAHRRSHQQRADRLEVRFSPTWTGDPLVTPVPTKPNAAAPGKLSFIPRLSWTLTNTPQRHLILRTLIPRRALPRHPPFLTRRFRLHQHPW
jgi:hypothetical protein